MANQFPPIFIISLKHSPRRQTIANRLDGLGIRFEFIDAVYGKDLTKEELEQVDYEFYPQETFQCLQHHKSLSFLPYAPFSNQIL